MNEAAACERCSWPRVRREGIVVTQRRGHLVEPFVEGKLRAEQLSVAELAELYRRLGPA